MPLIFEDRQFTNENFQIVLPAEDTDGVKVPVITSQEAIDDYGLEAIREKASEKYDAGKTDSGRVVVFTPDMSVAYVAEANPKIAAWNRQIDQLRQDIADLSSGKFVLWSQELGQPRVETNQANIVHAEAVIRMYEQLIEQERKK